MIQIKSLEKTYQMGNNEIKALDDVNITVKKSEFTAILGASGSGKSTLMNIIGCLDKPSSGDYFLCGQNVARLSGRSLSYIRNRKIGFIFQGFNLIPTLTARENVELPLIYRKLPHFSRKERQKLADEALEIVGLSARKSHKPPQLSGGQQQRVAIARAIAAAPELILADEPCGNLDSSSGKRIMDILCTLNSQGRTIVLITHDENAVYAASKVIRLCDGRVVKTNKK